MAMVGFYSGVTLASGFSFVLERFKRAFISLLVGAASRAEDFTQDICYCVL